MLRPQPTWCPSMCCPSTHMAPAASLDGLSSSTVCPVALLCVQGKITAMAAMSDAQRMELLKEIGGTRVYEERRKESLRILQEADSRGQQIKSMVGRRAASPHCQPPAVC